MKPSFLSLALLAASLAVAARAADPAETTEDAKKKEEIRALILADASKAPAPNTQAAAGSKLAAKEAADTAPAPAAPADATAPAAKPAEEPATMLPQVEVSKSRITNIDLAIQEQDRAIAREKVNTKPTKLDSTLNSPAVSKALAIFGGSSSEERSGVAQERLRLMQEEKDLLETMRLAHTPEERADLQKELDDLRAQRRELDQVPR